MTAHYMARQDCLDALERLSLLPSPPANIDKSSDESSGTDLLVSSQLLEPLKGEKAGDLSVPQLEMLLEYKKEVERNKSSKLNFNLR